MDASIKTDQIKMLEDFFNDLSLVDQKKIFMAGFRKAAKPLLSAARLAAPYKTGRTKKSFGTIAVPQDIAIIVGSKLSGANKGWSTHFIESGTKERFRRTKGNAPTGKVTGTHFFENAYNATESQIFDNIENEWLKEIDRFIIKINRRLK